MAISNSTRKQIYRSIDRWTPRDVFARIGGEGKIGAFKFELTCTALTMLSAGNYIDAMWFVVAIVFLGQ